MRRRGLRVLAGAFLLALASAFSTGGLRPAGPPTSTPARTNRAPGTPVAVARGGPLPRFRLRESYGGRAEAPAARRRAAPAGRARGAPSAPRPRAQTGPSQAVGAVPSNATLVYVGTYTGPKSKGIYLFRLQTDNLEVSQNITLVPLGLAAETLNPTHFAIDFKRRLLFAVNEIDEFEGKRTGSVSAFSIDSSTGTLTLINQRPSAGTRPCRIALDSENRNLLVANCGGGLAVLPVAADGRIGEPTSVVQQPAACLTLDPANQFAFACDQASDSLRRYRFDAGKGTLSAAEPASTTLKPGAGPLQLVFRPDSRFAYAGNERSSTITVFSYDARTGGLTELQTISTLPEYFDGPNTAAEVAMHPSGKYLYVSNRGHNSVVLFSIDADKGTLTYVEEQGTGGKNPRHFGIEPSARHLAIANQDSDTVLASRIDAGNGRLKPSGVFASAPSPVFVRFVPPQE
jgi:6-phosphogluconolactonase